MERKTWKIVLKRYYAGIDYDTNSSTYQDPEQVLTYVEAHDNHTLWDKLELTNSGDSEEVRKQMHKLSSSILLTSQGVPFYMQGKSLCGRNTVIIIVTNLQIQLTRWIGCACNV